MKKLWIGVVVAVILIAAAAFGAWIFINQTNGGENRSSSDTPEDTVDIVGEEASKRVDRLRDTRPDENADVEEQTAHYRQEILYAQNSGRCDDMVAATEKLESVSGDRNPMNLVLIAECYFNNEPESDQIDRYLTDAKKRAGALPSSTENNDIKQFTADRIALLEARRR